MWLCLRPVLMRNLKCLPLSAYCHHQIETELNVCLIMVQWKDRNTSSVFFKTTEYKGLHFVISVVCFTVHTYIRSGPNNRPLRYELQ
jgi:hypothetical protein